MIHIFASAVLLFIPGASPAGQIAFVSGTEQEDQCVSLLDLATGKVARRGPGQRDGAPVWSPDGQWLAFESNVPDKGAGVHVVRADGTGLRALNHVRESNHRPCWSADARRLAYSAGVGLDDEIRVYDLESNAEMPWGGGASGLMRPVWRDATSLYAIQVTPPANGEKLRLQIVIVTESGVSLLDRDAPSSESRHAPWAVQQQPDGTAIAFESREGGNRDVFLRVPEGRTFALGSNAAAEWNPLWSPDGKWLVFESFRGRRRGVYCARLGAETVVPVAVSPDYDNWHPTWSPDCQWLAFVSDRTGNPELFLSHLKGQTVLQLTQNPGNDYAPAWRPGPNP